MTPERLLERAGTGLSLSQKELSLTAEEPSELW